MSNDHRNDPQRDQRNRTATEQELADTFTENPEGLGILARLLETRRKAR